MLWWYLHGLMSRSTIVDYRRLQTTTVGVSLGSFNRDGTDESNRRHSGERRSCDTSAARSIGGVWHCRSRRDVASTKRVVRLYWCLASVVHFISAGTNTAHPVCRPQLEWVAGEVRCAWLISFLWSSSTVLSHTSTLTTLRLSARVIRPIRSPSAAA